MINKTINHNTISSTINPKVLKSFPQIKINHSLLGEIFTETRKSQSPSGYIVTLLKNKADELFGKEVLALEDNTKNSVGFDINVTPKYRNRNLGLGELLRLSSIMMILENGVNEFEIYSKPEAIYFHSKYKFIPAIKSFAERDQALNAIIDNKDEKYEDLKIEASKILEETKTNSTPEEQRKLCITTNKLVEKYIKRVLENKDNYKAHRFIYGMRMILKTEEILKNRHFFNSLFKKHNIDYKI